LVGHLSECNFEKWEETQVTFSRRKTKKEFERPMEVNPDALEIRDLTELSPLNVTTSQNFNLF